jgi:pimeloyl-ACP methyl ester carboxylesterase
MRRSTSYLDAGGDGAVLLALRAHRMKAATFERLAAALAPEWRVVVLDQLGLGHSDYAASYTRTDCIDDIGAWQAHLGLSGPVVLPSHSLGVNARQFAARRPDLVRGLIIVDIGAVVRVSDVPDGAIHLFDTGHFALEEDAATIADYVDACLTTLPGSARRHRGAGVLSGR